MIKLGKTVKKFGELAVHVASLCQEMALCPSTAFYVKNKIRLNVAMNAQFAQGIFFYFGIHN